MFWKHLKKCTNVGYSPNWMLNMERVLLFGNAVWRQEVVIPKAKYILKTDSEFK